MIRERIEELRKTFNKLEIDGFVVPKVDLFMGEYIRASDERLAFISGFTGSAGFAVITKDRAALFVDSRYRLQGRNQAPDFEIIDWPEKEIYDLFPNLVLGYDPRFLTLAGLEKLKTHRLIEQNPIDEIWRERPKPQDCQVRMISENLSGESSLSKIARLSKILKSEGLDQFISNSPESAAWLLNIRGGEIATVPAPHVVTVMSASGEITLYSDCKIDGIKTQNLAEFPKITGCSGFNKGTLPLALYQKLENPVPIKDPLIAAKAIKNTIEIEASKKAHLSDAIAFIHFWAWLEAMHERVALSERTTVLSELTVIDKLWSFRQQCGAKYPSFETIAGFGANGAIVHYRANENSNLRFERDGLLLLDSGAHYEGATTDITRTLAIGEGLPEAKAAFTCVLNGLAAISSLRFPKGLSGREIDAIAREPLWQHKMDYGHGTGHGVGAELSVHEGPQGISRRNETPLEAGMIVSLEPGYYVEGRYGIRHENLAYLFEDEGFMSFEALTFVPFDLKMIDKESLTPKTRQWLNNYHQQCFELLSPRLETGLREFLKEKCASI